MSKRRNILTIAGFDPSGGAGVLADIKTFEAHKCLGMAVQTANTVQTEDQFFEVNWISSEQIKAQLAALLERYEFDAVKVGLVPSLDFLQEILPLIRRDKTKTTIVWDPVLSASAGFDFQHDLSSLNEVLGLVDIVTPNWNEIKLLSKNSDALLGAKELSKCTKIYLKGGHSELNKGKDFLFENGVEKGFNPRAGRFFEKHGSGCVFSAALAANIAKGYTEQKAILRAKRYIEHFLKTGPSKLGRHYG